MKFFTEVRRKMPPGEHVYDAKQKGVEIMIHKDKGRFVLYLDGDMLDRFRSINDAKKAAKEFIKQMKG